jgi:acyl carrier protein
MELNNFVKLFAEQFEDTPTEDFSPEKNFRDFDEWSSLTALSIIAMIEDEYGIQISGADIRSTETIEQLYILVKSK